MNNVIVTGSIAFDHLMHFDGVFEESFMPDELSNLSISFIASGHDVNYGGCGANIAYSLKLCGVNPLLFGVLGNDGEDYMMWLRSNSIPIDYLEIDMDAKSSAAYVLSDKNQSQITFFSPSVMQNESLCMNFSRLTNEEVSLAIISPNAPSRMVSLANSAKEKNIKYIFDPGQVITSLSGDQIIEIIANSIGLIVNEYEMNLLLKKTSCSPDDLLKLCEFIVITRAHRGAHLYSSAHDMLIKGIETKDVKDATGSGDAFRAGFIYAYVNDKSLPECIQYGNVVAHKSLAFLGTQKHNFNMTDIEKTLSKNY
ncbi:hypothetical protein GF354_04940 [Candidatus Peregrinibacteria bacterium]|nr:hypothetical protein [Candidatus Peregrinibacteria bacterium]